MKSRFVLRWNQAALVFIALSIGACLPAHYATITNACGFKITMVLDSGDSVSKRTYVIGEGETIRVRVFDTKVTFSTVQGKFLFAKSIPVDFAEIISPGNDATEYHFIVERSGVRYVSRQKAMRTVPHS